MSEEYKYLDYTYVFYCSERDKLFILEYFSSEKATTKEVNRALKSFGYNFRKVIKLGVL